MFSKEEKRVFPSDEELIEKARQGDAEAFAALYKRYSGRIFRYIYGYVGDYQKAEDLTINTFLNVYENLAAYKECGLFLSWLYRIAANCAKRELENPARRKEISLETPIASDNGATIGDLIKDEKYRPDRDAESAELKEIVYKAIMRLDDKYKDALLLCDIEGLSYEEAAGILNITNTGVGTRLGRARDMLCSILKKYIKGL